MTIEYVEIDLRNLKYISEWDHYTDDETIRRGSVTLRNLFGQDFRLGAIYHRIYGRDQRVDLTIDALNLKRKFPGSKQTELSFSIASSSPSATIFGFLEQRGKESVGLTDICEFKRNMKITKYRNSIGLIIKGVPISRMDLIRFVANTKGGAHTGRHKQLKAELRLKYDLMDKVWETYQILDRNPFMFLLLGIAQEITSSDSVQKMYQDAIKLFPTLEIPHKHNIEEIMNKHKRHFT